MAKCANDTFSTFEVVGVGKDKKEAEENWEKHRPEVFDAARKRLKCSDCTCEGTTCTFVYYWAGPIRTEEHQVEGLDGEGNAVDIDTPVFVSSRYLKAGCFCVAKKHVWL